MELFFLLQSRKSLPRACPNRGVFSLGNQPTEGIGTPDRMAPWLDPSQDHANRALFVRIITTAAAAALGGFAAHPRLTFPAAHVDCWVVAEEEEVVPGATPSQPCLAFEEIKGTDSQRFLSPLPPSLFAPLTNMFEKGPCLH